MVSQNLNFAQMEQVTELNIAHSRDNHRGERFRVGRTFLSGDWNGHGEHSMFQCSGRGSMDTF